MLPCMQDYMSIYKTEIMFFFSITWYFTMLALIPLSLAHSSLHYVAPPLKIEIHASKIMGAWINEGMGDQNYTWLKYGRLKNLRIGLKKS